MADGSGAVEGTDVQLGGQNGADVTAISGRGASVSSRTGIDPHAILSEHDRGRTITQAVIDWFAARGVPAIDLVKDYGDAYRFIHLDTIVWLDGGEWFEFARHEPDAEVDTALTLVAHDRYGEAADIVAWQATTGRMASWLGRVGLLGEDQIGGFRLDEGGALPVHETVLDWLRARRRGVVIVDSDRAIPLLREAAPLLAASVAHGKALRKLLTPAPISILVPNPIEAAA